MQGYEAKVYLGGTGVRKKSWSSWLILLLLLRAINITLILLNNNYLPIVNRIIPLTIC
tara:strand:- start:279 stop:452 length:174 start_codon:yes stop_codon:yes gene_type:complete